MAQLILVFFRALHVYGLSTRCFVWSGRALVVPLTHNTHTTRAPVMAPLLILVFSFKPFGVADPRVLTVSPCTGERSLSARQRQRQEEVSCSSILFHRLSLSYSNSWQYWIPSIHRFYRKKVSSLAAFFLPIPFPRFPVYSPSSLSISEKNSPENHIRNTFLPLLDCLFYSAPISSRGEEN